MEEIIIVDGSKYSLIRANEFQKKDRNIETLCPVNSEFFSKELLDTVPSMRDILREEIDRLKNEAKSILHDTERFILLYGTADDVLEYLKKKKIKKAKIFVTKQAKDLNKIDFSKIIENVPSEVEEGDITADDIRVWDIIEKNVICVSIPGTRDDLLKIFKKYKVSGVPVVQDGTLVGIVTRRDILRKLEEDQIALLMTRDLNTISPHASIKDAAKILLEKDIRRLPVVMDGILIGMITVADIIKAIYILNINAEVKDFIVNKLTISWDETPIPLITRIMELSRQKAIPLINTEGVLSGIVTEEDIIRVSEIHDYVEVFASSPEYDDDKWSWEGIRNVESHYYEVSKIEQPMLPVKEIMIKDVITATKLSKINECILKMIRNRIDQIPIVSVTDEIVGMLYDKELLRILAD
ncbi:MAG: CBS domain-containing protein [Candidatus Methanoliparum thermophilum]|uniref:CBS domain-containing protein n=1 Tax=Methanoliparum thermophilum TaxID=2491083 RepID=A0A520KTY7_METT2|nr:CBS domain-containing protein [Candidatus Methanoliparum sp. LAM-1]RZN65015.1 MAG: CBS domain-containing protein [Candidatus Methanoliparum thermophilum]BDC36099.1 hypothetical protein MTLP_07810 [Candidatus Methanoliparum sp. LAM-1]